MSKKIPGRAIYLVVNIIVKSCLSNMFFFLLWPQIKSNIPCIDTYIERAQPTFPIGQYIHSISMHSPVLWTFLTFCTSMDSFMHPCQSPSMKSSMKPNSDPPTENPSATPTLANKIPIPLCMSTYVHMQSQIVEFLTFFERKKAEINRR